MANNPTSSSFSNRRPDRPFNAQKHHGQKEGNFVKDGLTISEVLDTLECPICLECLRAPIFMCSTGHNICGGCNSKLIVQLCPICKSHMTGQRNFVIEQLTSKIGVPCPNSKYGCNYRSTDQDLSAHLKKCDLNSYMCPYGMTNHKCHWIGPKLQLTNHFSTSHPGKTSVIPGHEVKFANFDPYKADRDIQLLSFANNMFVYHVKIDTMRQVALWALQVVDPRDSPAKWVYEFSFYNKASPKVIKTTEECTSCEVNIEALFETGDCVALPLVILKRLLNGSNLTFKFFLRPKAKPEDKSNEGGENSAGAARPTKQFQQKKYYKPIPKKQ